MEQVANTKKFGSKTKMKFLFFSIFGLFAYFVAFEFNGKNSILVDHIASTIKMLLGGTAQYVCVAMMVAGAIYPFINKTWNKNTTNIILTIFKLLGVPIGFMYIFNIGPDALLEDNMIPFLFESLAMSLTFIIPIGSALIIFLTDYGLMEFTGVFARPFMRPTYKTPGRSAIDAVASFVGSYSISLIITGKQYKTGYYTKKETAIIATGFSTVSATFCVVVAKTLDLMEIWNIFFWTSLFVTFVVTAITVRLWPLCKIPNEYAPDVKPMEEAVVKEKLFKTALNDGLTVADEPTPIFKNLLNNFITGLKITMGLTPSIMSVGLLGLILAYYTPVFDIFGYIFYPFTALLNLGGDQPEVVAKAVSMSLAEMFLPTALVQDMDIVTRFVVGVTCISEILFFSASIPCMISTEIPISIKHILVVWFERVALTLLVATPIAWLIF